MRKISLFLIGSSLLLTACFGRGEVKVGSDDGILEKQTVRVVTKNGKILTDPVHGKEVGFWYGALSGIDGVNANGVAFMYKFEDGTYSFVVNPLNILPLKNKKRAFTVWLAEGEGASRKYLKAGTLESLLGDSRHGLKLESKTVTDGMTMMLVTEEDRSSKALAPTTKVLVEGTLKRTVR